MLATIESAEFFQLAKVHISVEFSGCSFKSLKLQFTGGCYLFSYLARMSNRQT